MYILSVNESRDRTATLARLNPCESDGRGPYQVKIVSRHRFRTVDDAIRYAKAHNITFDLDGKKTTT